MGEAWTLLSPLYGGIVSLLLGFFVGKVKNMNKDQNAVKSALGALLRHDMFDIFEEYGGQDEVPAKIKEEMESLYKPYHALGFNNTGTKIYEEIMSKRTKV
jgi:ABC-type cobalt transport system substrate-binding protein